MKAAIITAMRQADNRSGTRITACAGKKLFFDIRSCATLSWLYPNCSTAGIRQLMSSTTLTGIIALLLYVGTLALQRRSINLGTARSSTRTGTLLTGFLGVTAHFFSASSLIYRDEAYHFGITEVSTLIFA
ncbi:MAG: hypothetical protein Q8M35_05605, partial [Pseudohongiella sp.]|nr:hypothetical protein [Pseudohongiella sp.]